MRPNFSFRSAASNAIPEAWWSAEVEEAVSERRKIFAAAHRSDENRRAYISASRHASSVIAKAKAESWQAICSSLSPESNPISVYSTLCSVVGSSSSFTSSPRESASVFAAYLRSHFSVSQPKALRSRARSYLSDLRRAMCPEDCHSFFCSFLFPLNFLRLPQTCCPPLPLAQIKLSIPC